MGKSVPTSPPPGILTRPLALLLRLSLFVAECVQLKHLSSDNPAYNIDKRGGLFWSMVGMGASWC